MCLRQSLFVIAAVFCSFPVISAAAASTSSEKHHVRLPPHPISYVTPENIEKLHDIEQQLTMNCSRDTFHFLRSTTRFDDSKQWAQEMLDMWGFRPTGYLANIENVPVLHKPYNVYYSNGNYDGCLQMDVRDEMSNFKGKYCPARLIDKLYDDSPYSNVGHCFPSTCSAEEIQTVLGHLYQDRYNVTIDGNYCTEPGQTKAPLTAATIITVGILVAVILLVVAGTYMEVYNQPSKNDGLWKQIALAFSVVSNTASVTDTTLRGESFTCLDGIRFLSMVYVIYHHIGFSPAMFTCANPHSYYNFFQKDLLGSFWFGGNLSVDAFFVLSGLLLTYSLLSRMDKSGGVINVKQILVNRFLRITPTYFMVLLIFTNIIPHLRDGPYWRSFIEQTDVCKKNWWSNVLFINNYLDRDDQCRSESWYLSVDMQFYILIIIVTSVLWRHPSHVAKILISMISFFVPLSMFIIYAGGYSHLSFVKGDYEYYRKFYTWPFSHVSACILGVGVGYILHRTKGKAIHLNKMTVLLGWTLSAGLMAFSLLGSHVCTMNGYRNVTTQCFMVHHGLRTFTFSLSLSLAILMCIKGYGGFLNTFLSNRCFRVLSRLGFTGYLVSYIIEFIIGFSMKREFYSGEYLLSYFFITTLVLSLVVGFIFTLLFELPSARVVKILQSDRKKKE